MATNVALADIGNAEWKGTTTGFLDHRLFKHGRNFPLAIFVIAVEGTLFYLVNNIYSGQVFGLWLPTASAVMQGAHLLPFFMVITFLAPLMSIYVTKRKDIKWPLTFGFTFFSVAIIMFALAQENVNLGLAGEHLPVVVRYVADAVLSSQRTPSEESAFAHHSFWS